MSKRVKSSKTDSLQQANAQPRGKIGVPWRHGAMKLKKGQVIPNPLIQPEIGSELSWLWRHGPGHSPDPLP